MGKKKLSDRFRLDEFYETSSDHFYGGGYTEWHLVDRQTGKKVWSFYGPGTQDDIHKIAFSANGQEVIAKNGSGRIVERVDLKKLAEEEE